MPVIVSKRSRGQPGQEIHVKPAAVTMAPTKPFLFFDLPAELRVKIFEYLVLLPPNAAITNLWNLRPAGTAEMTLTNLFLACWQMYTEASAIFYTHNTFRLNLSTRRMCQQLASDGGLFSAGGRDGRRRIRSLAVFVKRIGGDFERLVEPALRDMVLRGCLRSLEVRVWPQDDGRTRMSLNGNGQNSAWTANPPEVGNELVRSYPFQALLRLLVDPDLERADLWVWRVHYSIWCPFHDVRPEDGETCVSNMRKSGREWASVDVKALADAYGDGTRIIKIGDKSWHT